MQCDCGPCLGSHTCPCVPDEWRSEVPELYTCQRTRSGNLSTILSPLVDRQSSRSAYNPTRILDLGRQGWGTHVLPGTGTMDCSWKRVWGCEGGLLRGYVADRNDFWGIFTSKATGRGLRLSSSEKVSQGTFLGRTDIFTHVDNLSSTS